MQFANQNWIVPPKVGILAGGGELPGRLVRACREADRGVFVITFEGQDQPDDLFGADHACHGVGAISKTIKRLRSEGCEQLVMAGNLRRPALKSIKLDFRSAKLLPKLARIGGDDSLLSVIVTEMESAGFTVIAVDDLLPSLLAPIGPMGNQHPGPGDKADIAKGIELLRALGSLVVGQAVVVEHGRILAIEGAEGTKGLLERVRDLKDAPNQGVLVKCIKTSQDARADRPAIGPDTVAQAVVAGLAGIAVEAGATLVLDQEETVRRADQNGLFVTGFERVAD